jgi:hypothetical protein
MLVRQILQNKNTQKWSFIEWSTEEFLPPTVLGGKEFDSEEEAKEYANELESFK